MSDKDMFLTCSVHFRNFPPSRRALGTTTCAGSTVVMGAADAIFVTHSAAPRPSCPAIEITLLNSHETLTLYQSISRPIIFGRRARTRARCMRAPTGPSETLSLSPLLAGGVTPEIVHSDPSLLVHSGRGWNTDRRPRPTVVCLHS